VESWLNSIPTSQVNLPSINCFCDSQARHSTSHCLR
jgi:hypothetical protein